MGQTDDRRGQFIRANQRHHGAKKIVDMKRELLRATKNRYHGKSGKFRECRGHASGLRAVHQSRAHHHLT